MKDERKTALSELARQHDEPGVNCNEQSTMFRSVKLTNWKLIGLITQHVTRRHVCIRFLTKEFRKEKKKKEEIHVTKYV